MNEKFFRLAKNVSELSDYPTHHLGCVVIYKGKVISSGFNCNKTHPIQRVYNRERFSEDSSPHYLHAETHALVNLINDRDIQWNKVVLYNFRAKKDGSYGLSRPCKSCMRLIRDLGIKQICYTTEDGVAGEEIGVSYETRKFV